MKTDNIYIGHLGLVEKKELVVFNGVLTYQYSGKLINNLHVLYRVNRMYEKYYIDLDFNNKYKELQDMKDYEIEEGTIFVDNNRPIIKLRNFVTLYNYNNNNNINVQKHMTKSKVLKLFREI